MTTERSTPIEKYALLSDTHTAALVAEGGSIDWLCLPRFDSQAVFTRLLGTEEHGHWRIDAPGARVLGRRYLGNSFVLETTWESDTGTAVVTDFMPMDPDNGRFECTDLLRQVRCTSGEIDIRTVLRLRFDYGQATPFYRYQVVDAERNIGEIRCVAGPDSVYLRGPYLTLNEETGAHLGEFRLRGPTPGK